MSKVIVGYFIYGPDNGGIFLDGAPSDLFCPKCGLLLSSGENYAPENLHTGRIYPFSFTNDNRPICSSEFVSTALTSDPDGVSFVGVSKDKDLFLVSPRRKVTLDYARRKTIFANKCNLCGHYAEIAGASPGFIKDASTIDPNGFYRTDVSFGSGKAQAPAVITGTRLKEIIDVKGFLGVYFKPIFLE
ncbi:hypothetical protein [Halothiobacillus diazotrophicus]|uniref:hypothetical protein n=1 Tax=Halothiobacillus diazotrophicus TaxID=1860122 RepID=UPI0012E8CEC5|nr:hypothetical protein [Halothiobacillus diazotrophicus]